MTTSNQLPLPGHAPPEQDRAAAWRWVGVTLDALRQHPCSTPRERQDAAHLWRNLRRTVDALLGDP